MASTSFVPKGQKGLLLRSPLTMEFSPPSNVTRAKPIYSRHFDQSHSLSKQEQDILNAGGTPKKIGFYTRNNPHPGRVRHMKGLNDIPICYVEDQIHQRFLMSAPSGQDLGPGYRPPGSTRYGANRGKGISAVGIVPVTYAWRDELEKKTQNALQRAMGNIPPASRAGLMSRTSQRGGQASQFDGLGDNTILDLLCRILQTESIPACQAWLSTASETEKGIVLNMIRMAATGEFDGAGSAQGKSSEQGDFRYVWAPGHSQQEQLDQNSYLLSDDEFDFYHQLRGGDEGELQGQGAGLFDPEPPPTPFKFPEHDTVIKTARQLSSLASRQSSRAERIYLIQNGMTDVGASHKNGYSELKNTQRMSRNHPRSTSLSGPVPTGNVKSSAHRPRSRSANAPVRQKDIDQYPPPPVKVSVSKDNIQVGKPGSAKARIRYTSHWD